MDNWGWEDPTLSFITSSFTEEKCTGFAPFAYTLAVLYSITLIFILRHAVLRTVGSVAPTPGGKVWIDYIFVVFLLLNNVTRITFFLAWGIKHGDECPTMVTTRENYSWIAYISNIPAHFYVTAFSVVVYKFSYVFHRVVRHSPRGKFISSVIGIAVIIANVLSYLSAVATFAQISWFIDDKWSWIQSVELNGLIVVSSTLALSLFIYGVSLYSHFKRLIKLRQSGTQIDGIQCQSVDDDEDHYLLAQKFNTNYHTIPGYSHTGGAISGLGLMAQTENAVTSTGNYIPPQFINNGAGVVSVETTMGSSDGPITLSSQVTTTDHLSQHSGHSHSTQHQDSVHTDILHNQSAELSSHRGGSVRGHLRNQQMAMLGGHDGAPLVQNFPSQTAILAVLQQQKKHNTLQIRTNLQPQVPINTVSREAMVSSPTGHHYATLGGSNVGQYTPKRSNTINRNHPHVNTSTYQQQQQQFSDNKFTSLFQQSQVNPRSPYGGIGNHHQYTDLSSGISTQSFDSNGIVDTTSSGNLFNHSGGVQNRMSKGGSGGYPRVSYHNDDDEHDGLRGGKSDFGLIASGYNHHHHPHHRHQPYPDDDNIYEDNGGISGNSQEHLIDPPHHLSDHYHLHQSNSNHLVTNEDHDYLNDGALLPSGSTNHLETAPYISPHEQEQTNLQLQQQQLLQQQQQHIYQQQQLRLLQQHQQGNNLALKPQPSYNLTHHRRMNGGNDPLDISALQHFDSQDPNSTDKQQNHMRRPLFISICSALCFLIRVVLLITMSQGKLKQGPEVILFYSCCSELIPLNLLWFVFDDPSLTTKPLRGEGEDGYTYQNMEDNEEMGPGGNNNNNNSTNNNNNVLGEMDPSVPQFYAQRAAAMMMQEDDFPMDRVSMQHSDDSLLVDGGRHGYVTDDYGGSIQAQQELRLD